MTQPFSVEDLYLHRRISGLDCADAMPLVACAVTAVDRDQDDYISCLWRFALDGSEPVQLTRGPGQDTSPRWSPDASHLAFLSDRSGSVQVHLMRSDGGEAWPAGDFAGGVSQLRWCPDGQALLVTAAVVTNPDLHGARPGSAPAPAPRCRPEVAWRLPYKEDGVGFLLQREFHLFQLDVATGAQRQLSDGAFDVLAFDVSHDGRHIAYSRSREGRFAHASDLWICNADGGGHRRLTQRHAIVMQPCWSPDGRRIAFTGALKEGDAEPRLWLVDLASGSVRVLGGASLDVADPQSVRWSADGRGLVLLRAHRGRHQIVSLAVDGNRDDPLRVLAAGDRQISHFGCCGDHFVYAMDQPTMPSELWARPQQPGEGAQAPERQLSQLNPWWWERTPIALRSVEFVVPDGQGGTECIEGWLLRAAESTGPQPLLNDVHGGPASYALLDYDSNVYWQVLCSRGWSVLALNAVGSASYGREFCQRLAGRWGSLDLPQHLEAVRQLRARGVAGGAAAICGKSYGGYLGAYATGNTDAFDAAVVMAPVGNIETHYGTSDGGYYADPFYMASAPGFDRALARRLSPLQHIEKSATPTLFLQGKEDERCPKCQSEELFVSLLRAGDTPAELVLYPGENHAFLASGAPSCREDAARRILDWLERFTQQDDATRHRTGASAEAAGANADADGVVDADAEVEDFDVAESTGGSALASAQAEEQAEQTAAAGQAR